MDKSSFRKLFKELYSVAPDKWNTILEKSGKTNFSKSAKPNISDSNSMGSKAFQNLMNIDYKHFQDFSRKQNADVNRPKSIRLNGQTINQFRKSEEEKPEKPNVEYTDSSAVRSFQITDNKDGSKDVTIQFTSGPKQYLYPEVAANVADGLYAAPSKGTYVQKVLSEYSDYSNPKVQQKIKAGD